MEVRRSKSPHYIRFFCFSGLERVVTMPNCSMTSVVKLLSFPATAIGAPVRYSTANAQPRAGHA